MFKELEWAKAVQLASPYSYALVVSLTRDGAPNVMGVGWWCYLSAKPKLLGIAVSPERLSHNCIMHSMEFTLNFPNMEIALEAWKCGQVSGRHVDKIKQYKLRTKMPKVISAPLLVDSTAAFECKVKHHHVTGDHTFFVGEIVACHGDLEKKEHLFTQFFSKLVSISNDGRTNWKLDELLGIPGQLSR